MFKEVQVSASHIGFKQSTATAGQGETRTILPQYPRQNSQNAKWYACVCLTCHRVLKMKKKMLWHECCGWRGREERGGGVDINVLEESTAALSESLPVPIFRMVSTHICPSACTTHMHAGRHARTYARTHARAHTHTRARARIIANSQRYMDS